MGIVFLIDPNKTALYRFLMWCFGLMNTFIVLWCSKRSSDMFIYLLAGQRIMYTVIYWVQKVIEEDLDALEVPDERL